MEHTQTYSAIGLNKKSFIIMLLIIVALFILSACIVWVTFFMPHVSYNSHAGGRLGAIAWSVPLLANIFLLVTLPFFFTRIELQGSVITYISGLSRALGNVSVIDLNQLSSITGRIYSPTRQGVYLTDKNGHVICIDLRHIAPAHMTWLRQRFQSALDNPAIIHDQVAQEIIDSWFVQ